MTPDSTELPPALRARLIANPLWDFALALYAREGVEAACLHLQDDAGLDVCELLWRCWLFHHGVQPTDAPTGLAEIRRWQQEITAPLRRLRRTLKAEAATRPAVADLRRTLQRAELEAERETLARLEALTADCRPAPLPSARPGLKKHLADCLQLQKKSHLSALQRLESSLDPSRTPR
ncbi:TIGR02444 family protein [Halomonas kalidii]|uniref:TIGR02444 family protein n=1 Tax=Halomonas kalidii TaxID=3043293 RepID=A0ABT6VEY1_9GAMM|nr:TIGR02444 family protein [Halomonas kalidii]MDI5932548.1 TIGR02444 family protein [Halomonas kalidii]